MTPDEAFQYIHQQALIETIIQGGNYAMNLVKAYQKFLNPFISNVPAKYELPVAVSATATKVKMLIKDPAFDSQGKVLPGHIALHSAEVPGFDFGPFWDRYKEYCNQFDKKDFN